MEEYLAVQSIVERLNRYGAEVETQTLDWLQKSFGEFAQLTEAVVGIRLRDAAHGDEVLTYIIEEHLRLLELRRLEFPGCAVSDACLRRLSVFRRLAELDVSGTPVTWQGLQVVRSLPELVAVGAEGTRMSWWDRMRLAAQLRRNRKAGATARTVHPINVR
jgi:hypothetical protein